MAELVDVYPYRFHDSRTEFLVMKRAPDKIYAGQWRMVAGKVEGCEKAWQSGLRELKEETGTFPKMFWAVPSLNQFYDFETDTIFHIPVFAAELDLTASITLNDEHTKYQWIESHQISTFLQWPEQQRLLSLICTIIENQQILDAWKISL